MQFVKSTLRAVSNQQNNVVALPLSPAQAKEQVLAHWDYLDRLCQRRFPNNCNLAHEGLLFIMEHFENDDWKRIRTWQGKGRFSTYLTTLGSRLLTDFQRKKQGHIRLPSWLQEKQDPIWVHTYQLLIVEGFNHQEVISKLQTTYPDKEDWFLEEIISTVRSRCDTRNNCLEPEVGIENIPDLGTTSAAPERSLAVDQEELTAVVWQLLQEQQSFQSSSEKLADKAIENRINVICRRLRPHLHLSSDDTLLLRLRFIDGYSMTKISQLMKLEGDPYKRLHKIIHGLRIAFQKSGINEI
ncbi:MAG: hypothetical protein MI976_22920 [Pseudomonadales bacterium]|nr:hypothetical protein [Pseudomonadales bacterium]